MTASLLLILAGLAATLLRVATGRENPLTPHIPRPDEQHELTLLEISKGARRFAAVTWRVHATGKEETLTRTDGTPWEGAFGL